jgi:hypothetical protein
LIEEIQVKYLVVECVAGRAGMVIGGSTVHSTKAGLGIPVGNNARYKELGSHTKRKLQGKFSGAKALVMDEFTMS